MGRPIRLGILATHPIQYHAPLYRLLAARGDVDVTVFFAHRPSPVEQGAGFGVPFEWDIDLTSGFNSVFLHNHARTPGVDSFLGCDTPGIASQIAEGLFDAFLVSGWHSRTYWQAIRGCTQLGVPLLVRGDSQLGMRDSRVTELAKRFAYPKLIRQFDVCLSTGRRSREYFVHYGARDVVSAPHFVDNDAFASSAEQARPERDAIRAAWRIPADACVALFAGKLIPKKRPLDLIRAVAWSGRPDLWALIVGAGALRDQCEREARRLNAPVRFAGFLNQTEIARAYAASDVLVLPSDRLETWGLVVNEGMATGLPAIVSDAVGCAPDLVIEGRTGHLFPMGDDVRLAQLLAWAASHRVELRALGRTAQRHIRRFTAEAAANGVVEGVTRAMASERQFA